MSPGARALRDPAVSSIPPAPRDDGHSANALPIGTRMGEFEITGVLGEGGFGIVYRAMDHSLGREIAIKEYMPSALASRGRSAEVQVRSERNRETFEAGRKSFVNEAHLLARFDHPSLVKVYLFWEVNGTAYMVMPYYKGVTLKQELRALGHPPDEQWLLRLIGPLTEALMVIHQEHCWHRDIAPDNVIVLPNGRPLLLDFGAARQVINDMTHALTAILKPGYAPVEQYAEVPSMKQGAWTDVYALAATIHYAIRGKPPPESIGRMFGDTYEPLATACAGAYSPRLLEAIDRALTVQPELRTQSIAAFRADIGLDVAGDSDAATRLDERAQSAAPQRPDSGHPAAAQRHEPAGAGASASARPPLIWVAAACGVLLLAAAVWLWMRRPESSPTATPAALAPQRAAAAPNTSLIPPPPAAPDTSLIPPPPAALREAPPPSPVGLPPEPPAITAAAAPFDVGAAFEQVLAAQDSSARVTATATMGRIRIDKDNLSFTLQSNIGGEVTVLALGTDQVLARLIPSKATPKVTIKAGQSVRLPPANAAITGADPAGRERLLVIVSPRSRSYGNFRSHVDPYGYLVLDGPSGTVNDASGAVLPLLLGDPGDCRAPDCNRYGAATFTVDVVK